MSVHELEPAARREIAFDVLANNESKALSYMAAVEEGEVTWTGLQKAMQSRFEDCQTSIGNLNITFVKFGFAEQFMAEGPHISRPIRHFRPINTTEATEAIGSNLMWGHTHELALGRVLSGSGSNSDSRAPTNSVSILRHLLKSKNVGETDHNYSKDVFSAALSSLLDEGIVEAEKPASFRILDPTYTGRGGFEYLTPATQHAFKTLALAKSLFPDQEWTLKQLKDLANATLPEDQQTRKFRMFLHNTFYTMASADMPDNYRGALEKKDTKRGKYKIADPYVEPVADLVERHAKLLAGEPGFLRSARDDA